KKTNFGIHKSDFRALHSLKNIPAELASQGEQKAILLSITIASILAKKSQTGLFPVLLLDEVAAHLDDEKRGKLFNFLENIDCQIWLTGTDKHYFEGLRNLEFVGL
ncbi:MAG: DNA replication and repair protein RecF, partial [Rickettsiales bacterium]|nr:DNA replication and repair protein RecF [Rickettsiales bacterium]